MLENKPVLYTTHCPLCKGLEKTLKAQNIQYEICTDLTIMKELGITRVPMLSVDGELLSHKQALRWALSQEQ